MGRVAAAGNSLDISPVAKHSPSTGNHHLYPLMPLVTSLELKSLKRAAKEFIDSLVYSFKTQRSFNIADTESANENPTRI